MRLCMRIVRSSNSSGRLAAFRLRCRAARAAAAGDLLCSAGSAGMPSAGSAAPAAPRVTCAADSRHLRHPEWHQAHLRAATPLAIMMGAICARHIPMQDCSKPEHTSPALLDMFCKSLPTMLACKEGRGLASAGQQAVTSAGALLAGW